MIRIGVALLTALLASAPAAHETDHPVTLWRVAGTGNAVYLLGSVHLLREKDYPLPRVVDAAYEAADVVVMELDMDDLDPAYTQAALHRAGVMTDGTTLRDRMGDELYARAEEAAAVIDIPLDMLAQSEPWLAAMTVEIMMLYRVGFDPKLGVDMTIANRASADGKPIEGLETVDEQLAFLDGLPLVAQRDMLLQTLADSATLQASIDDLIDAWHNGDTAALEDELLSSLEDQPVLRDTLIRNRNRRWARTIASWLDGDRDYLVVVGALHLVGDDGVPALLANRGFGIHQLSESAGLR